MVKARVTNCKFMSSFNLKFPVNWFKGVTFSLLLSWMWLSIGLEIQVFTARFHAISKYRLNISRYISFPFLLFVVIPLFFNNCGLFAEALQNLHIVFYVSVLDHWGFKPKCDPK